MMRDDEPAAIPAAVSRPRGIKGELYPCKPDIFAATYERIARDGGRG